MAIPQSGWSVRAGHGNAGKSSRAATGASKSCSGVTRATSRAIFRIVSASLPGDDTRDRCVGSHSKVWPLADMTMPPHYLAIPKSGTGPGVLVLHSWWGLNPFFKELCDRFARAGFVALAPDLYSGKVATTVAAAKALRAQATASRRTPAYKMLIAAIEHLSHHAAVTAPGIALVGFSMGGHWALWLAQRPELPICATVI
ncbi:MAG: hypothetical protein DWQ09_06250 [Proteobacteria bacterium]|nr:MAG: hypothetical protein DWQ09_06250 [Pseudomonadota bacterium]